MGTHLKRDTVKSDLSKKKSDERVEIKFETKERERRGGAIALESDAAKRGERPPIGGAEPSGNKKSDIKGNAARLAGKRVSGKKTDIDRLALDRFKGKR